MQNRQPNGSELVIARCARINDASTDIQVGLCITVIEDIAMIKEPRRGKTHKATERDTDQRYLEDAPKTR